MFRTIPNALVLYPSDSVSTERAVEIAANYKGLVYIKGGRSNHPVNKL
jgi:transketolase